MEEVTNASNTFVKNKGMSTEGLKTRQLRMKPGYFTVFMVLLNFALIIAAGHFRDFVRYFGYLNGRMAVDTKKNIAAKIHPIVNGFSAFYMRHIWMYGKDNGYRPLISNPGAEIEILERKRATQFHGDYKITGKVIKSLNFGSYNYLGERTMITLYIWIVL